MTSSRRHRSCWRGWSVGMCRGRTSTTSTAWSSVPTPTSADSSLRNRWALSCRTFDWMSQLFQLVERWTRNLRFRVSSPTGRGNFCEMVDSRQFTEFGLVVLHTWLLSYFYCPLFIKFNNRIFFITLPESIFVNIFPLTQCYIRFPCF